MRKQNTIQESVEFKGKGLHSGKQSTVVLKPAPEDTGLVFVHKTARDREFIPFTVDNVIDTRNNISIGNGKAIIKTVEHLTAALYGMRVDNCIIECDSTEVPIMDGSSQEFVKGIRKSGVLAQEADKEELKIINPIWVTMDDKFIVALPYQNLKLSYTISFPNSPIGTQTINFHFHTEAFIEHLSEARTFGFVEDIDYLKKNGLVLGGDMENVHVFSKTQNKPLNPARYDDEPVRHKMLDLLGALALLPFDINAFLISYKGGHTLDSMFAKKVMDMMTGSPKQDHVYRYGKDLNYYYTVADILNMEKFPS